MGRSETGMRIWVRDIGCQATMHFEFHHACSDGAGGLAFVEDIFAFYAAAVGRGKTAQKPMPRIDPSLLRKRSHFPSDGGVLTSVQTALPRSPAKILLSPPPEAARAGDAMPHSRRGIPRLIIASSLAGPAPFP